MDRASIKARTIRSLFWKLLERAGNQTVLLVVQIVMARLLAPDQFGMLAIMLVFVNVGNVIVQSGLGTALVQCDQVTDDDYSTVFWICFTISLVLYAVVFVAAPFVAAFYHAEELAWPLRALAIILPIGSFNAVQVAIVQRALDFRKVFNATLTAAFVSGIGGVACAVAGAGLWALVLQQIVYWLCSCAVLALQVRWHPSLTFDAKRARRLFSFGWKLLVSGLMDQGYQSFSDLVIGKQFDAASLGLVSQGKKYPSALGSMLDGALQPVMLSAVSRAQGDVQYAKRLVRRALKTSTFVVVPAMALFAVAAEPIVRLLLGEQWLPCVPFLQMYCIVCAMLPIHSTNLSALNGMGRSDLFLKLEFVKKGYGVVCLAVAAFVFHDIYLMVGSYILTGVVSTFVNAWPNRKTIGYSYSEQLRDICPAFLLAALAAVAAYPLSFIGGIPDLATIALQTIVVAVLYLGAAKLFRIEALAYLLHAAQQAISARKGTQTEGGEPIS